MSKQDLRRLVGYCGLYCGLCAHRTRIPQQARQLKNSMRDEGYENWYQYAPRLKETFPPFWQFLQKLIDNDCTCRTDGGPPDYSIRQCAKQKAVEVCPQCKEYPCELVEALAEHYPNVIQDGKRLQQIGLEKWVKEQEERAKRGAAYADMRVPWRR